jgi:hypothetical protein
MVCDGNGQCIGCLTSADCPGTDTDCAKRACVAGVCGKDNTPSGTPVSQQIPGDCKEIVCNGNGGTTVQNDDGDLGDDGNPCSTDLCINGVPLAASVPNGTACAVGVTCVNGACNGCATPASCPGVDDECKQRTCVAGACGVTFTPSGTQVMAQTTGDCLANACDGAGNIAPVMDNTDLPVDGLTCTLDICTAGIPGHPPTPRRHAVQPERRLGLLRDRRVRPVQHGLAVPGGGHRVPVAHLRRQDLRRGVHAGRRHRVAAAAGGLPAGRV